MKLSLPENMPGTPVKQDRLLPPLEIVPLTEAETN